MGPQIRDPDFIAYEVPLRFLGYLLTAMDEGRDDGRDRRHELGGDDGHLSNLMTQPGWKDDHQSLPGGNVHPVAGQGIGCGGIRLSDAVLAIVQQPQVAAVFRGSHIV